MNPFENKLGPEERAQVAVVRYIGLKYPNVLFHHSPQETYTKSNFQKWKNRMMGTRKGCPDILIFEPTKGFYSLTGPDVIVPPIGLAIEMKHGRNKCTPDQNNFLNELEKRGWQTAVCYDSEEAMHVIDEYLGGK